MWKQTSMPRAAPNPWIVHVKKYRASHPGVSYGDALQRAAPSYRSGSKKEVVYTVKVSGQPKLTDEERKKLEKTLPNYVSLEDHVRSETWLQDAIANDCKGKAKCAPIFDVDWYIREIEVPDPPKTTFPVRLVIPQDVTPRPSKEDIATTQKIFKEWLESRFHT